MRRAVDKFSAEVTLEIPELEELFAHINMGKDLSFEEMVAKSEKIQSEHLVLFTQTFCVFSFERVVCFGVRVQEWDGGAGEKRCQSEFPRGHE